MNAQINLEYVYPSGRERPTACRWSISAEKWHLKNSDVSEDTANQS